MDFFVPADHRGKRKENEKIVKYRDLTRKVKNYRTWEGPFEVSALGMVPKVLKNKRLEELELRDGIETVQTKALPRSVTILRRVLRRLAITQIPVKDHPLTLNNLQGALGSMLKDLVKGLEDLEIRGQVETIQIAVSLRSTTILSRVLKTWGDLLSLKLQCKTTS